MFLVPDAGRFSVSPESNVVHFRAWLLLDFSAPKLTDMNTHHLAQLVNYMSTALYSFGGGGSIFLQTFISFGPHPMASFLSLDIHLKLILLFPAQLQWNSRRIRKRPPMYPLQPTSTGKCLACHSASLHSSTIFQDRSSFQFGAESMLPFVWVQLDEQRSSRKN